MVIDVKLQLRVHNNKCNICSRNLLLFIFGIIAVFVSSDDTTLLFLLVSPPFKSSFLVAYRSIDCRVSLSCHRGLIHLIGQPAADKTLSWRGSFSIKSSWNKKRLLINDSADEPLLGLIYLPADKYLSRTWSPSPFLRLLFIVLRGTRADMIRLESFGAPSYSNSN